MSRSARHVLLNYTPDLYMPDDGNSGIGYAALSLQKEVDEVCAELDAGSSPSLSYDVRSAVHSALDIVALRHWEFDVVSTDQAQRYIQIGFDRARQIFLNDWSMADRVTRKDLDKTFAGRRLKWYEPFHRGLILGLLAEHYDEVSRTCEWPEADMEPEYKGMGGDLEVQIAYMYLLMASELREGQMEGVEKLVAKVAKCRTKRPRLLYKLWQAVLAGEQSAFDKAMQESLAHHWSLPKIDPRMTAFADRLALPQTAMCLIAMNRGLSFPNVEEPLGHLLITRQSLGLD